MPSRVGACGSNIPVAADDDIRTLPAAATVATAAAESSAVVARAAAAGLAE